LETTDGTYVAIVDDGGDADKQFRCKTENGQGNITLDCGNGQKYSSYGSVLERTCTYHVQSDNVPQTYHVSCSVNNETPLSVCQENIIVDEDGLGYCGDGIRQ
jgi:hypothetical protein